MNLSIDEATEKRLVGIRSLGESQIRPVGLEADRLGVGDQIEPPLPIKGSLCPKQNQAPLQSSQDRFFLRQPLR